MGLGSGVPVIGQTMSLNEDDYLFCSSEEDSDEEMDSDKPTKNFNGNKIKIRSSAIHLNS